MSTTGAITELERLRRGARRRVLRGGAVAWVAVAAPATVVAVLAAGSEPLRPGMIAATLSGAWLLLLGWSAWRLAWRPWRALADRVAFARAVEAHGGFANLVVAAEEAARRPDRWSLSDPVAAELARRLDDSARDVLAGVASRDLVPLPRVRAQAFVALAGLAAGLALLAMAPATAGRGLALLGQPLAGLRDGEAPLVSEPAPAWVRAGGSLEVAALDHALEGAAAVAEVRFGDGAWQRLPATARDLGPAALPAGATADGPRRRWQATISGVREDFSWRFRRGKTVTGTGRVVVRHPPLLARLAATVEPPAYTGLPRSNVERLPAASEVPAGSRVVLRGTAGDDLATATLRLAGDDSLAMAVDGSSASAAFVVEAPLSFTVVLRDRYGLASRDPLEYRLAVLADQLPVVSLSRPGDDGLLPLDGRLTLLVEAADDYGLRSLELRAWVGADEGAAVGGRCGPRAEPDWRELALPAGAIRMRTREVDGAATPLRAVLALEIEAAELELMPGDVLGLFVEARDNRTPGGGQAARSATLRFALPSAADVLASQAESAEQSRGELEAARQRGRELDADLDRLARELLKNPLPDWARQQEIEAALERQQALQRELARVAAELERQMEQLAGGQLTSEAQEARAGELSELLAAPQGQELADLLRKLQQEGSAVAPDEISRAMEQVAQAQKDLERRVDAALSLMERMAEQQKIEGATALLEDLMRRQQELADLSRQLDDGERDRAVQEPAADELARRQESLARDFEQLQERLTEALDAMTERNRREAAERLADARRPDESSEQGSRSDPGEQAEEGNEGEEGEQGGKDEKGEKGEKGKERDAAREQALREALEKLKQQQKSGSMGRASQMLQQMDPGQAARMQQQALRDLGSLYSVLVASQQAMQSAMKMEQVSSLRGLAADLLALSRRQEEVGARIPAQLQDVRNIEITRQQHRLQKAALGTRERLALLTKEAPNRILKLLEKMDGLVESMGGTVRALEEGRAPVAREQAGRSLAEANRIVIGLLTEAQMSSQGGGGGSGQQQSASEQLQELARRQAELNGATDELRRMLADRGISQEARSRMERLGQQQAELGRDLGKVAERERERPQGDGSRLLGDMAELERQMERLGDDLGSGEVSQEVLQRQDRILGRLLDARNAVRERDYSTRRESRAANQLYGRQDGRPGSPAAGSDGGSRQRYRRLEEAPLEYRDLVRRYFAAIDSLRLERDAVLP